AETVERADDAGRASRNAATRPCAPAGGLVMRRIRVLHLLVTTGPGGGPKHVFDLVRKLPHDEFEVIIAAPRDGVFFDRFWELGITMVELPLSRLGVRHLPLTIHLIRV